MRRVLVVTVSASLIACWGAPGHLSFTDGPPEDDEIWLPDNDTGPEDTDVTTGDGVSPVIEYVDAWCYITDDSGDWWGFEAMGDDPQGTDTLAVYLEHGVLILDSEGGVVATVALVCEYSGHCWSSAQADHIDLGCNNPAAYDFVFHIEDQQGHESSAASVQGRYGSGPTG